MNCLFRRLIPAIAGLSLIAAGCGSSTDEAATPELASIDDLSDGDVSDTEVKANDEASNDEEVSDSSESDEEESGPAEEMDPDQAFALFQQCMADNGVKVEFTPQDAVQVDDLESDGPPDPDETGITDEDLASAQEACHPILENVFGSFDLDPEQEAERADIQLDTQRCLDEAGFDIELDSDFFVLPPDVGRAEFEAALSDCSTAITSTDPGS